MKKSVLVVANWKMHPKTQAEAKKLLTESKKAIEKYQKVRLIVAPPAVFLAGLSKGVRGKRLTFAAQHMHTEETGSFTGSISMPMFADVGASAVLIGHAESRHPANGGGDTDEDIATQVALAIKYKKTPILCIGERVRDAQGLYLHDVRKQISTGISKAPKNKVKSIIFAYEPVWAIGAKEPMSTHAMHEMSLYIRKILMEYIGPSAGQVSILYGGSIDETNAKTMVHEGEVQGLLVGRASTDGARFNKLIHALY